MLNLTIGHWVARLTYIAAKLKLADLLNHPASRHTPDGRPRLPARLCAHDQREVHLGRLGGTALWSEDRRDTVP